LTRPPLSVLPGLHPPRCRPCFRIGVVSRVDEGAADWTLPRAAVAAILAEFGEAVAAAVGAMPAEVFAPLPTILRCVSSVDGPADRRLAASSRPFAHRRTGLIQRRYGQTGIFAPSSVRWASRTPA
jgi:hypothetical protein